MADENPTVPLGFCQCGCGQRTTVPRWSDRSHGRVAGRPLAWVAGHARRPPVETLYRVDETTGCWVWQGTLSQGYGVFTRQTVSWLAHRYFYEQRFGVLVGDLDHLCRNRACVNPDHLEPCGRGENVRRGDVAKLDWGKVAEIRATAAQMDCSQREASRRLCTVYGVSAGCIRNVLTGQRWPEAADPTRGGRRGN